MVSAGAALVVHDLKNELGALEAALDRLALHPDGPAARATQRQCRALRQRFVAYLALYGQGETLRAHCEDDSPQDLLQLVARRQSLPDDRITIRVAAAAEAPPFWYFDRRLVGLALDAAVHNALRFAGSEVVLGARLEDGHLVLGVDDDGPGLGAADEGDAHATGLGTQLCREVARCHGTSRADGGVRLFNRAAGRGARFELWLAA
jgi:signal transduction histidine kinase